MMPTYEFRVRIDVERESGPRVHPDDLPHELAQAIDSELPVTLWCEPADANEESGYRVTSTHVEAIL